MGTKQRMGIEWSYWLDRSKVQATLTRQRTKLSTSGRGSEWAYLDSTKHLIFWLCNMKQLRYRHFNTSSIEKLTMTVNSFQRETKTVPKGPVLFCLVYQRVFGYSGTFSDSFRRLSKTTEDSQKLAKISEHVRRLPKISNEKSEHFRPYFRR